MKGVNGPQAKTFEVWAILLLIKYIKFQNFDLTKAVFSVETSGVTKLEFSVNDNEISVSYFFLL